MEIVQKWGFGMAPLKPQTEQSNKSAIEAVCNYVIDDTQGIRVDVVNEISVVKGIFNRVVKQDQWDWFTNYMYLDYPPYKDLARIVSALATLRKAILEKNNDNHLQAISQLINSNYLIYCDQYLSFDINNETNVEYIYVLSRREEKNVLKIGMTTRNVLKRVNEINSATGVVFPWSPRKVYKVKDSKKTEQDIHSLLSQYRIRNDREFFRISFAEACKLIENYLCVNNQMFY